MSLNYLNEEIYYYYYKYFDDRYVKNIVNFFALHNARVRYNKRVLKCVKLSLYKFIYTHNYIQIGATYRISYKIENIIENNDINGRVVYFSRRKGS